VEQAVSPAIFDKEGSQARGHQPPRLWLGDGPRECLSFKAEAVRNQRSVDLDYPLGLARSGPVAGAVRNRKSRGERGVLIPDQQVASGAIHCDPVDCIRLKKRLHRGCHRQHRHQIAKLPGCVHGERFKSGSSRLASVVAVNADG